MLAMLNAKAKNDDSLHLKIDELQKAKDEFHSFVGKLRNFIAEGDMYNIPPGESQSEETMAVVKNAQLMRDNCELHSDSMKSLLRRLKPLL